MTLPTATPSRYLLCLSPECEVFPVRTTEHRDDDGVLVDRAWEPVAPAHEAGPEGCLTALVAHGELSDDAQLDQWHPTSDDAAIVGYWTIDPE